MLFNILSLCVQGSTVILFFQIFLSSQIRCPVQGSQAWVQVILHCIDALSLICWCFFLEPFSPWHSISKLPGFGRRRCFLNLFSPLFPSSPFLIAEWWGHSFSPVSNPLILSALQGSCSGLCWWFSTPSWCRIWAISLVVCVLEGSSPLCIGAGCVLGIWLVLPPPLIPEFSFSMDCGFLPAAEVHCLLDSFPCQGFRWVVDPWVFLSSLAVWLTFWIAVKIGTIHQFPYPTPRCSNSKDATDCWKSVF